MILKIVSLVDYDTKNSISIVDYDTKNSISIV